MNSKLYCVLFILSNQQSFSAAQSPYKIISNSSPQIDRLEEKHRATWRLVFSAINSDSLETFKRHLTTDLINKAVLKTYSINNIEYVDAYTLLETIIAFGGTKNRAKMIALLLKMGAGTQSTYTVACPEQSYYNDHYTPIFYAAIKGNVKAFEALWQADHEVPVGKIMRLWLPEQEIRIEDFILIDGSQEDLSTEPVSPILQRWSSLEIRKEKEVVQPLPKPFLPEMSIRGFLLLMKNMIEHPKEYPNGAPIKQPEGQPYVLPSCEAIVDMLRITEVEPGFKSLVSSSLSSMSSFFFG